MKVEARNTPCRCNRRHRACREGSWTGGGVLLAWGQRLALWRTQHVSVMEMPLPSQVFWWQGGPFHPLEAPNSRFWRRSGTRKKYPRATTSPKPRAQLSILAKDIPQGSILTKMVFDKIGEGGGGAVFRFSSVRK